MAGPVVLRGPEAEKVWATFWEKFLRHGRTIAAVCRDGTVAVLVLEAAGMVQKGQAVFPLDPSIRSNLISKFEEMGDTVSADWLRLERPGRVLAFYQDGSFLLNLDLTKDPTQRESYSIEPGSLSQDQGLTTYQRTYQGLGKALTRQRDLHKEFDRVEAEIARLKKAQDIKHDELRILTEQVAKDEVDLLEMLVPSHEISFGELLIAWSRQTTTAPATEAPLEVRKIIANQLEQDIEGEILSRGLDRWITNGSDNKALGSGVRAKEIPPTKALASLMAAKLYGLISERVGLPSGRWVTTEEIEQAAKEMILPPATTPHNFEVVMMSLARFAAFMEATNQDELHGSLPSRFKSTSLGISMAMALIGFGLHWREMAFARLELGHKLASALMFTDMEETVQAPWTAWSLILPDGLLGEITVRRVWCLGDQPAVLLMTSKEGARPFVLGLLDNGVDSEGTLEERARTSFGHLADDFLRAVELIQNLIRGVCLTLSDPKRARKGDWYGKPSEVEIKKPSKHKELPLGERYVLGHPVQIDLREEVLDHVRTGKVGGKSPTKLFLVRGHPRNQAHGPGMQLRKPIWVEPFWKGPEDARVLLRSHQA